MATLLKRKVTLRHKQPVGTPVPPPPPPPPPPPVASTSRRLGWGLVLGLLLAGGLAYAFWPKSDKANEALTAEAQTKIEGLNVDSLLKAELDLDNQQIAAVVQQIRKDSLLLSVCRAKGLAEAQLTEQNVVELWRDLEAAVVLEAGKRLALSPEQLAVSSLYSAHTVAQAQGASGASTPQDSLAAITAPTTPADTLSVAQGKVPVQPTGQAVSSSSEAQQGSFSCFFAFDSTQPSDIHTLKAWVQRLKSSSERITISSYTDVTGGSAYNLELSKRRAEGVRQILLSEGIAAERISLKAMGETDRFGAKPQNRRADLVLN